MAVSVARRPGSPAENATSLHLERRRLASLWLAVFATLATVPGGYTRFVFAKLLVICLAGVVAALGPRRGRLPLSIVVLSIAGMVLLALSALFGQTTWTSLMGRWPRYEGLPVVVVYVTAAWIGARTAGGDRPGAVQLGHACAAMSVVLSVFSLLGAIGLSPLGDSGLLRDGSLLGNASEQGAVAMMVAVLLAPRALRDRAGLEVAGMASALLTVALSGSRTALGLTIVGLVVVALAQRRGSLRTGALQLLLALSLLGVAILAVPVTRERLFGLATGRIRLEIWGRSLELLGDHWWGLGGGRYVDVVMRYENLPIARSYGPYVLVDSPHNMVLQVAIAGGIPLVLLACGALFVVARRSRQAVREHPERLGAAVAVGCYVLSMMFNFTTAGPTCLAALLLGFTLSIPVAEPAPGVALRRPVDLALAGALAATCVFWSAASVGEVELRRGLEAAFRGDISAAQRNFERLDELRPWDSDADMLAAAALARAAAGYPAAVQPAMYWARNSLARTPESHTALVALAMALNAGRDFAQAADVADTAVALAPMRADGLIQRSIALSGLGETDRAARDARRAAFLAPGDAQATALVASLTRTVLDARDAAQEVSASRGRGARR